MEMMESFDGLAASVAAGFELQEAIPMASMERT
jgi:hypothetical protein